VMGLPVADVVIPPHLRAHHTAGFQKFVVTGTGPVVNQRIEVTALHRDGRELPVELSIAALRTPDGHMANAFLHDITERKAAAARITASNRRLMAITDNLPLLVSYIDKNERIRFANWTWRDWLGVEPASMIGRPMAEVVGSSAYEQRRDQLRRALAGEQVTFEAESVAQGMNRYLQTVYIPDVLADGSVDGIYAVSTDITLSKQVELRLEQLAHIDPLTALPNRRRFDEKLVEAIARSNRSGQAMALMLLDVDHFKQINDTHGHLTGDAVLKEFARRVQRRLRVTDTAARYAGDEFAVILEGLTARADVAVVARKICEDLHPWFQLPDRSLKVTSSIGAAIFEAEAISPADAIRKADEALYEAKRAGRARFVVRQP
jgi:diguanylate cyclase (GGDEF)-like protein/PAS domain S-box-containing protein